MGTRGRCQKVAWMQKLYETYEQCYTSTRLHEAGSDVPLLPICHTTQQAQIEVIIDIDGNFLGARVVPREEATTVVPCTEESGGRAGTQPVNHPLCDKLQYVAGDFVDFGGKVTSGFAKNPRVPFESYLSTLKAWCESEYSHPRAQAVLRYVNRCRLVKDLIASCVLVAGDDGKLIERWEKGSSSAEDVPAIFSVSGGSSQMDAFVRWVVEIPGDPGGPVWQDPTLFESWIKYYASTKSVKSLCYVTGTEALMADQHPAKLRNKGDKAKLISSNDTSGFTFRGRFLTAEQACGVSFEVSQKAHAALRWLIGRQGYTRGSQTVVAWATSGKEIPSLHDDSFDMLGIDLSDATVSEQPDVVWTAQEFALQLNRKIAGYRAELGDSTDVVVMSMEAATPGRMSITFYRELRGSEFLDRVEHWHSTCCWIHDYKFRKVASGTGKRSVRIRFVGAPSPSDIAEAAYGSRVDEKLRKAAIERILPCIVDGRKVPRDLVDSVVRRASNRMGVTEEEWQKALSIACALYRNLHQEEGFTMALDESRRTRDYLYGRLLALAESLEKWAQSEAGEDRPTNAARLMQRFAEHPFSTWRTIELALTPYLARLGNKAGKRQQIISEVMALFKPEDFVNDSRLSGEFLLGYHCQREELYKRSDADEKDR